MSRSMSENTQQGEEEYNIFIIEQYDSNSGYFGIQGFYRKYDVAKTVLDSLTNSKGSSFIHIDNPQVYSVIKNGVDAKPLVQFKAKASSVDVIYTLWGLMI